MDSKEKIEKIINLNFDGFIKLVNLNVIPLEKAEDTVIATNNARYIYLFAQNVEGTNVRKLEEAIIKTKNIEYISKFAENILSGDIAKLEDAIIATKDVEYIYEFACNVKGVDKFKIQKAIHQLRDKDFIERIDTLVSKEETKLFDKLQYLVKNKRYLQIQKDALKYKELFNDQEVTRKLTKSE